MVKVVLVAWLLVGCSNVWEAGSIITPTVSNPEHLDDWAREIERSIALWQSALGDCEFPFVIGAAGTPIRLNLSSSWGGEYHYGLQDDGYIEIRTSKLTGNEWLLAHEFGHAMGLEHVDVEGSLMNYTVGRMIDPLDVEEVRARYGCE